jgi:hypothetical protein
LFGSAGLSAAPAVDVVVPGVNGFATEAVDDGVIAKSEDDASIGALCEWSMGAAVQRNSCQFNTQVVIVT